MYYVLMYVFCPNVLFFVSDDNPTVWICINKLETCRLCFAGGGGGGRRGQGVSTMSSMVALYT